MWDSLRQMEVKCPIQVSNLLNFHFANIGSKLCNDVAPINTSSTQFLKNAWEKSLHAMPTTEIEVYNIINQLKNKPIGLDSLLYTKREVNDLSGNKSSISSVYKTWYFPAMCQIC